MKFIIAILTVTLFSVDAGAGGCRTVYRGSSYIPYVAPVVVKKAVKVYDVADYYPVYNRSYLESYDDSYQKERQQQQQINIELLKSLNLIQQQLQSYRGQAPQNGVQPPQQQIPPMPPAEPDHPAVQYFRQRCAKCHTQGSEKGGLAMFSQQGQFFIPTCEQAREIVRQMRDNHMPKGGPPPTDQEYSQAVDWQLTTPVAKGR